jgi:hypothetical protein
MARQEKLSRYRGLNPYLQKQRKESAQFYVTQAFDDQKVGHYFLSSSGDTISYPTTFNISSSYLIAELTTSLYAPGREVPSNLQQYIQIPENELPTISPFDDRKNFASDNFSTASYQTGSVLADTGPGFQQPLRNKTKIEILMPLNSTCYLSGAQENEALMGYYNFTRQAIEGIGVLSGAADLISGSISLGTFLFEKAIGFGPSLVDYDGANYSYDPTDIITNQALPIKEFGFPSDFRYNATDDSGYCFFLSNSITEPFLLERAVLEVDRMALTINGTDLNLTTTTCGIVNFFLLNKRPNNIYRSQTDLYTFEEFATYADYPNTPAATNRLQSTVYNNQTTKMDLVTFARIGTTFDASPVNSLVQEGVEYYLNNTQVFPDLGFTVNDGIVLNLDINQATKNTDSIYVVTLLQDSGSSGLMSYKLSGLNGSRSGVDNTSDRNWLRQISGRLPIGNTIFTNKNSGTTTNLYLNSTPMENNPYLLFPQDRLIIGWQAPFLDFSHLINDSVLIGNGMNFWNTKSATAIQVSFTGIYKLTLYGSYLRMNDSLDYEEYHKYDTSEQSLNTVSTVNIGEPIFKKDES